MQYFFKRYKNYIINIIHKNNVGVYWNHQFNYSIMEAKEAMTAARKKWVIFLFHIMEYECSNAKYEMPSFLSFK